MQHPKIFEVSVARPNAPELPERTWIMLADSEDEARDLVPGNHRILGVTCKDVTSPATGDCRIIGWYGQPAIRAAEHPVAGPHPTD